MGNVKKIKKYIKNYTKNKYGNFVYIDKPTTYFEPNVFRWGISPYTSEEDIPLIKKSIDDLFESEFNAGLLKYYNTPEVVVSEYPRLHLYTWPVSPRYPISHSSLRGPDGFYISKRMLDKNYNIITNNCSNATGSFFADLLGIRDKLVNGLSTPGRVREAVIDLNIPGTYERKLNRLYGPIETIIPLNLETLRRFNILKNYDYNSK